MLKFDFKVCIALHLMFDVQNKGEHVGIGSKYGALAVVFKT